MAGGLAGALRAESVANNMRIGPGRLEPGGVVGAGAPRAPSAANNAWIGLGLGPQGPEV